MLTVRVRVVPRTVYLCKDQYPQLIIEITGMNESIDVHVLPEMLLSLVRYEPMQKQIVSQ